YDVGTDYLYTYVKYFEHFQKGWRPYSHEPLFQLLNICLVSLNLSYVWLFAISGFIIIACMFYYIFKYSPMPIYSVVIFFCSSIFFNSLNNVRQYIAIAIAIIGLSQKNVIKTIVFIGIAAMFHMTAIIYIAVYILIRFLKNKRITQSNMLTFSIICMIATPIFIILLKKLLAITPYSYFLNSLDGGFSILIILVNFIVFIFTLFYYDNKDKEYQKLALFQLITVICCISSMLLRNEELWMRIMRMFSVFQIILIPKIVLREKNKISRIFLIFVFVLIFSVYTFYTVYLHGGLEVFPYHFVFGKV
ncbi:MAG: EpsG family protein, partial [Anaeroplasmataceae bacterium]|nr:EpsG family protein [Anaeroplasmataceae bacterium]